VVSVARSVVSVARSVVSVVGVVVSAIVDAGGTVSRATGLEWHAAPTTSAIASVPTALMAGPGVLVIRISFGLGYGPERAEIVYRRFTSPDAEGPVKALVLR
jgi:hypothetical protein